MSFKKAIRKIHLWLGLASGLLVVFLGITGCILAFQREMENATQSYRFVEDQRETKLAPSVLKAVADSRLPGRHAHSVSYEKGKASKVVYFSLEPAYYYTVFLNPYNGQVLKVKDMESDFFHIVTMGHYYLWLPPEIGQPLVASGTLVFVVLLFTGIILWWPRNKASGRQRFTVKWNGSWKRINYDLHSVLGFYLSWVLIFVAITGLVMGFQWFSRSVYWAASGGEKMVDFYEPPSDTTNIKTTATTTAMDLVWAKMLEEHRQVGGSLEVHVPHGAGASIETAVNPDTDTYWQGDYRYFDQYTLREIPVPHVYGRFSEASLADKIMRMNYDIHVGAIGGIVGKTIAFFASLLAASLPVTGFVIWWGRKKQKKSSPPESYKGKSEGLLKSGNRKAARQNKGYKHATGAVNYNLFYPGTQRIYLLHLRHAVLSPWAASVPLALPAETYIAEDPGL